MGAPLFTDDAADRATANMGLNPVMGKGLSLRKQLMSTKLNQADTFILHAGDSNTAGLYAGVLAQGTEDNVSNGWNRSMPAAVSRYMADQGFEVSYSAFFGDGALSARETGFYPAFHPQVALSSNVSAPGTNYTLGGYLWRQSAGTTGIDFTPASDVDTFEWFYAASTSASTATEAVDGGSTTNVNQQIGSGFALGHRTVAAGSAGSHTLNIGRNAGNITFCGAIGTNSTKKQVYNMNAGFSGAELSDLFATAGGDRPWRGLNFIVALAGLGFCHAVVSEFMINEMTNGTTVETFETNYRTFIEALQAVDVTVILGTCFPLDPDTIPLATQLAFVQKVSNLAAEYGCPLFDDFNWLGGNWQNVHDANLTFDARHMNGWGYSLRGMRRGRQILDL